MRHTIACLLLLAGCLDPSATDCGDGTSCPIGKTCHAGSCVSGEQLVACNGLADGSSCTFSTGQGTCNDHACIPFVCGNGVREAFEECDGADLGGASCLSRGFYDDTAALGCLSDCRFDTNACTGRCGDTTKNGTEQCDADDLGDATCKSLGYYDDTAALACSGICKFDTTLCTGFCGDGNINGPEQCDGAWTGPTCLDFSYDAGRMECSNICRPSFDGCGRIGWRTSPDAPLPSFFASRRPPLLGGGTFKAMWGANSRDIWAVGFEGLIAHYDGLQWTQLPFPSGALPYYFAIWGSGPSDIWIVGQDVIQHFNGSTWTTVSNPHAFAWYRAIWGSAANDVWAVGDQGEIIHYNGTSWSDVTPASSTNRLRGVWGSGPNDVWAVGDHTTLLHYNGAWTAVPPADIAALSYSGSTDFNLLSIWGTGPKSVWVGSQVGELLHFDGASWQSDPYLYYFQPTNSIDSIWGSGDKDIWLAGSFVAGGGGTIVHYDGTTYTAVRLSFGFMPHVWGTGTDDVWSLVGGTISHYSGTAATPVDSVPVSTRRIWSSRANAVWAFGGGNCSNNACSISFYDGYAWNPVAAPSYSDVKGVWGSGPGDIWAMVSYPSSPAGFLHFDGNVWSAVAAPTNPNPNLLSAFGAIWGSGPSDVWAVGGGPGGSVARYDGVTWSVLIPSPTAAILTSIWGSGPNDVWAVGYANTVLHFNGSTWQAVSLPGPLSGAPDTGEPRVWGTASNDVWAVGLGVAFHYDGSTWSDASAGLPPGFYLNNGLWGAHDDVWAVNASSGYSGAIFSYDGVAWSQIRATAVVIGGTARHVFIYDGSTHQLDRVVPWSCQTTEVDCGDAVDNDCDGKIDDRDPDCAGAIRLSEVSGGNPRYIEVVNRTSRIASLSGLELDWQFACDASLHSYMFMPDSSVAAGQPFRIVDDRVDVRARERYAGQSSCASPTEGGWVALCSGPCDLTNCSNVLDVFVAQGATAPPACASFSPAPFDVMTATTATSATRTMFAGSGSSGQASDWSLQPRTRN